MNGTLKLKYGRVRIGKCTPQQIYNKDLINVINFAIKGNKLTGNDCK